MKVDVMLAIFKKGDEVLDAIGIEDGYSVVQFTYPITQEMVEKELKKEDLSDYEKSLLKYMLGVYERHNMHNFVFEYEARQMPDILGYSVELRTIKVEV